MAELSPEEFKKSLFTTFRSRGVLEALKSQLRNRLIKELQETAGKDDLAELHGQSENTETVCKLAANSLVADHLKRCNYEYSLSVFMPESGLQEHKLLTMRDILLLLKIREGSELYKNMEIVLDKHGSSNGLLVEFLSALGVSNDHGKSSKAVQASLKQLSSIEDKLQSVERQYLKNLQTENQKWSSQTEKWLLGLHKQWEHDKKKLLEEELEEKYAAKAEKLKADEREKLQLLSTQQQLQEEEAHAQRQKLLEDMLSLKQRETEFDLNHQMKAKTLKLEEERINVLSQELKIKKSLLEDAEANFNRRLDEEVQRYKLKCDEESHDRRQTLELREKRLQRDLDGFERKQGVYINTSDELQRTKGKLKELQIQLDDNKTQLALALQQKEMMSIKLSEDLEAIKERDDALAKENAILNRNLLKYEDEEKGNQRLISELREKSMESAADLLHLRDQLKQMEKTAKSKEKSWKDYKTKMESRLDEECQKRLKYQQLYEETMMSQSALNQEVADLKLTLQQTQQVLDVELGRRRANSIPCMESMPSELESPAVNTTQWEGDRTSVTDSAMDETSSTVVMIAQSKELFDRLEKEAKELEESYQKFQSRINQMELDVHSTSRSPDLHYPTQNLHGNTSFD
ncbi:oral-facial-digital syndrome 1 protein homolog isoform X1 [Pocillopora damicornis]|uniref:oral-facial-digital syndrome 1 protein homolog isoform X1 n=1 Tax=Pocillopora damicornis TaxID=46731 RepID=UPI000F555A26|nr:oral-facial-digital syndrome 1 protein homolog isoform X1 [Pocillopora damicornis]